MNNSRPVLIATAATMVFLALAAALTPSQSPILPIEICVVLLALGGWVALRRSRPSYAVLGCFSVLLVALTVHITAGDLGDKGPRELVPDFLILATSVAMVVSTARATFNHRSLA